MMLPPTELGCTIFVCVHYVGVSVICQSLTCDSDYDVLWRTALAITLLSRRVWDVRGDVVWRGAGQNHRLLIRVRVGRHSFRGGG